MSQIFASKVLRKKKNTSSNMHSSDCWNNMGKKTTQQTVNPTVNPKSFITACFWDSYSIWPSAKLGFCK